MIQDLKIHNFAEISYHEIHTEFLLYVKSVNKEFCLMTCQQHI